MNDNEASPRAETMALSRDRTDVAILTDSDLVEQIARRSPGERSWALLLRLDEGQRSAIGLAYFGGHTYRQVAVLLALPEGTVKTRIRQGLAQLRQSIEGGDGNRHTADGRGTESCGAVIRGRDLVGSAIAVRTDGAEL